MILTQHLCETSRPLSSLPEILDCIIILQDIVSVESVGEERRMDKNQMVKGAGRESAFGGPGSSTAAKP